MQDIIKKVRWSSRWAFVLAASGSAVGLGNVWKFPYIMGSNGGGAFILVYLICMATISLPIMMSEILIGRASRLSPIGTINKFVRDENAHSAWKLIGWMGLITGILILSFYSVIAGWTIFYSGQTLTGGFSGLSPEEVGAHFGNFISNPLKPLICHTVFMLFTMWIVARGVKQGIELAVRILMPLLFIMLLFLMFYSMAVGDFAAAWSFMFDFDFSKVTRKVVVDAIGHSFFTLSLGMGAILMYGAYLPRDVSITRASGLVIVVDVAIALIAGLIIMPLVFAYSLEPGAGPGLVFVSLPVVFAQMPGGSFFGGIFFLLLLFAALTSAISMLEPAVSWLCEKKDYTRKKAACLMGLLIWSLGILTVMSFGDWAFSFNFFGAQKSNGMFDIFDILTSNISLPLGGILIALFAGWIINDDTSQKELGLSKSAYMSWKLAVCILAPIALTLVLYFLVFASV